MISLFSEKYNRNKYLDFLKSYLLPDDFQVDIQEVTDQLSFKANKINQVTVLGNSETLDLAVFEMHHDSENDPRVTISRDAFKILASFNKNRAMVFFTSANLANYRLSLITIDLELDNKKTKKLFSNPRRYSYLLGNEAKLGTLFDKLVKAKQISGTAKIKDFADLVGRFAVEPVTKEFFNKYKELYDLVINEFEKSNNFKIVMSKTEGFNSDIFARKLLGQITFLYFLQKKRWLGGDPSNTNDWTDGRQDFLRWGFEKCQKEGYNYFDKFLEKLFYEGLNQVGDSFKFNDAFLKIPYLNGGLFECPYEYDETIIFAPSNDLFSNQDKTGILDIFDLYNFTIDENTYFEQDIAIDPEMLGKVFENLLDDINRKGKGAFYTPREIVNYMTRESLKQFLITKLQDEENIEKKLDHLFEYKDLYLNKGDFANNEQEEEFEKQFNELYDIVEDIDKLLVNIKIADPAVGSGAFPMGILHEIVSIRSYIKEEFLNEHVSLYQLKKETIQKCIYGVDIDNGAIEIAKIRFWLSLVVDAEIPEALPNFDYKFMQGNSLIESFGDININQVRTKYSDLEKKDEEITNKIADINQEVDVIQKKFFAEFTETSVQNQDFLDQIKALEKQKKTLIGEKKKLATQLNKNSLLLEEDQMIDQLHYLQEKLYQEDDKNKKVSLRNEIEETIVKIFKTRIEDDKEEYFQAYNQMITTANQLPTNEQRELFIQQENVELKKKYKFDYLELETQLHEFTKKDKIRPFFPWHLYFADVFKENGGFDIVIGNPPYLRVQGIGKEVSEIYKTNFESATGSYDLYVLFVEKVLSLLSSTGIANYIIPHKWINSAFGKGLRSLIKPYLQKMISFNEFQVFNASTYTSLVWFTMKTTDIIKSFSLKKNLFSNNELSQWLYTIVNENFVNINKDHLLSNSWYFPDEDTKNILSLLYQGNCKVSDKFDRIFTGLQTSMDTIYILHDCVKENGIINGYSDQLSGRISIEERFVKPILKGDQVHRYEKLSSDKCVVFPYKRKMIDSQISYEIYTEDEISMKYPLGYKYLKMFEEKLRKRENYKFDHDFWFQFGRNQGLIYSEHEKLIQPDISLGCNFAYDEFGDFFQTTTLYGYIKKKTTPESYKFYLSLFNSKLMWWFITITGTTMANGYYRFMPRYINEFPLPNNLDISVTEIFEILTDYILLVKNLNYNINNFVSNSHISKTFEDLIDLMVLELYFGETFHSKGIEFISPASNNFKSIIDYENIEHKVNIIHDSYKSMQDHQSIIRNNMELVSIEFPKLVLPIKRSI